MPLTPTLPPPGTDQYRGLSGPNGLLTAGDVLGGLNGARLEATAEIRRADGTLIKEGAERELARLRGQERVLEPDRFYRDIDHHLGRVQTADDLLKSAETTSRASKTLPIKVGGALAVAGIGYDIANGKDPVQAVAAGGGGFLASVGAGAATGAVIGTFVPIPGVGTAVGAVVGAGVGVFTSGAIDSLFENGPDVGAALRPRRRERRRHRKGDRGRHQGGRARHRRPVRLMGTTRGTRLLLTVGYVLHGRARRADCWPTTVGPERALFAALLIIIAVGGLVMTSFGPWFENHRPDAVLATAPSGAPATFFPRSWFRIVMSVRGQRGAGRLAGGRRSHAVRQRLRRLGVRWWPCSHWCCCGRWRSSRPARCSPAGCGCPGPGWSTAMRR